MRSDDPRIEVRELDGQRLLLPSEEAWGVIQGEGVLDGRPIGVGRLLEQYRLVAMRTPGVRVALGEPPGRDKPWWIYHLVQVGGGLRRVRIDLQQCHGCGWRGRTGNPHDFAIYVGTGDPLATLRTYWDEPALPCPSCGAALPQPAIWISPGPGG